jgi:hypothetical protein
MADLIPALLRGDAASMPLGITEGRGGDGGIICSDWRWRESIFLLGQQRKTITNRFDFMSLPFLLHESVSRICMYCTCTESVRPLFFSVFFVFLWWTIEIWVFIVCIH